jgi:hypothetical protein
VRHVVTNSRKRSTGAPGCGAVLDVAARLGRSHSFGLAEKWSEGGRFRLSQTDEMESATVIYDRAGNVRAEFYPEPRRCRSTISPELPPRWSQLDARFYKHKGVDFIGIASRRKLSNGADSSRRRTPPSNWHCNTFLISFLPTIRIIPAEVPGLCRPEIEKRCDKKVLEHLNRVGSGIYGAEAAARLFRQAGA